MEENVLNEAVVTEDPEIIFDTEDIAPGESPDASEETIPGDARAEETEAAPEEWSLDVKYNGEQRKLSKEEAVELAQKGLNYDKIAERLKTAEGSEELKQLKKLAAEAGVDPSDYLAGVTARLRQADEEKLKKSYLEKGVSDKLADELVREERQRAEDRAAMNELKRELEFFKARERAKETWTGFLKEHPEITSYDELPSEVKEGVRQGKELADAYNAYEIGVLKQKLALEAQAKSNMEKAPSSVTGSGAAEDRDDFLKGFFGSV